ncbi:MAG: hypothetical protein RL095_3505 [Verrucomicrobiota bacterium]|jgi:prepilin-type processing-associated H-X9-DG protein
MRKKTFTLLELLGVICIILILASLLVPAFGRARKMAKLVICGNNLKQLHMTFALFERNCRELPPGENGYNFKEYSSWQWKEYVSWDDHLAPYMSRALSQGEIEARSVNKKSNSDSLLRCPTDKDDDPQWLIRTYSVNAYDLWFGQSSGEPFAYRIPASMRNGLFGRMKSRASATVSDPGCCYLLTEGFNGTGKYAGRGSCSALARDSDFGPYRYHSGKRMVVFVDGHVACTDNFDFIPGTDTLNRLIRAR